MGYSRHGRSEGYWAQPEGHFVETISTLTAHYVLPGPTWVYLWVKEHIGGVHLGQTLLNVMETAGGRRYGLSLTN